MDALPHVVLSAEKLLVWDGSEQMPLTFFEDLGRTDSSIITRHQNLWIVTHDRRQWSIKQRSY